jgi:hypothetical protein
MGAKELTPECTRYMSGKKIMNKKNGQRKA